jgi:hypothetical protein
VDILWDGKPLTSLHFQDDHYTINQDLQLPGNVDICHLYTRDFKGISPKATAFQVLEKILKTMNLDKSISVNSFAQFLLFLPGVTAISIGTCAQREGFFYEESNIKFIG